MLACLLAVIMVIGIIPMSVLAVDVNVTSSKSMASLSAAGLSVVTDDESTLAPGVKLNELVVFDKNGARVEMYVTTVDTTVDTVRVYANYMDNQNSVYGLQTLSDQVAAMEANYKEPFKIVAGINASYYNTTTGKPTGAFVMEGIDVTTESEGNAFAFFAVLKDGTYMIGAKGDYSTYKGQIKEAIGGYVHIVKDGAVVDGLDKTTKYPRQTLGLTADGKLILMTADGSQTQTVGLTYQEQAEVMLALGCVDALHLDGGNSATFGTIPEGSDKFVTTNSPSGGAERAVSNTLMIVSTAVADGTFDHAIITGDYDYFVPYSTYTFSAFGVDATNAGAEIPETAVWTLSDDSFGTISNGTFVSSGKLGDVNIQLSDNGEVVGSKTIHVVDPTQINFAGAETTVPYGKTAPLTVSALYGNNEVFCDADTFAFAVDPAAAGTMNGFDFTAAQESAISSAVVTATYKYNEAVPADTITVKFGKGSEVLFDFEDGDISDWHGIETIYDWIDAKNAENPDAKFPVIEPLNGYSNGIDKQTSSVFLASEENGGRVKSGDYALGFRMNHLQVTDVAGWLYNYLYYTGETQVLRDAANGKAAVRIGMWVYVPDITNVAFRIVRGTQNIQTGAKGIKYSYMKSDYDGTQTSYATNYAVPEAGWIYVYYDLTDVDDNFIQTTSLYDPDNNNGTKADGNYYPAFLQLFTGSATDTMNDIIYYIDDITLDYSDVTEDRDAPVISNTTVSTDGANDVVLNGQKVDTNLLSFSANVTDDSGNANATGLDYTTAKIYVDGIDMSGSANFKAASGIMSLSNVNLVDGEHSICFAIFDKQGNETRITKTLTVDGNADNAKVYIAGRNDGNHTPKAGSVYYLDIKTSDASQIGAVTTTLKLNTANSFEYQNIICAEGVTATAKYDALDFELTVTLIHDGSLSGEAVLASIPVRVWAWDEEYTGITSDKQFATTAIPVIDIAFKTVMGRVTFADGAFADYVAGFHTAMDVKTELDNKTVWHTHTAAAIDDKTATCTMPGYTGRTYCEGCASVINWGTVVKAAGHTYEIADGVLKCECGLLFTGVFTDGKTYVDGVAVVGWVGESFFIGGEKITGVQKVPAPDGSGEFYYDFGEEGACTNLIKYTGLLFDKTAGVYRYAKLGVPTSGWNLIDDAWHHFDTETFAATVGETKMGVATYEFEETGKIKSGCWVPTLYGMRYYYGPDYYRKGWQVIDGKDYYFENNVCLTGGWQQMLTIGSERLWYYFNEDGSCDKNLKPEDGFYTDRNGYGYAKDGKGFSGLQQIDGTYYYFDFHGYALSGSYAGRLFGDDFKAFTGILEKNGTLYYYLDGITGPCGLVKVEDAYYYSYWGGVIKTGTHFISDSYCDLPAGEYVFGEDGKAVNGIQEMDGQKYLYVNGRRGSESLFKMGDAYYGCDSTGKLLTNGRYFVSKSDCDLPAGNYEFGADGKMLDGVVDKDGKLYLYVKGTTASQGLYKVGDDYYFSDWGGVLKTDGRYYIATTYCDLPANKNYSFGAEGKMLNGVEEVDGVLYLYQNGTTATCGLFEVDGEYYYAYWGGVLKTNGRYYVSTTYCDLPANQNYSFDAEGKMLNGVEEVDGVLYLYQNGTTATCGLFEVDGEYYYAYWGGVLKTDDRYYVSTSYCDLAANQNYSFDAEGKMLNGVEEVNGVLYLYENGTTVSYGLYEVDGKYYFADWGGVLRTDGTYYISSSECDLPANKNYSFGENGEMLNGFITQDDGIYYYVNGSTLAPGLIYVDGYYYYVSWGGKIVTNATVFVSETNGYSIPMNYTFDAQGRAVL